MKKFLLLAAVVAAFAGNAQELQLTKSWEAAAPALANTRQGLALDGKFLINNKVEGIVYSYAEEGVTQFGQTEATAAWPAIAKDQAGNVIVRVDNSWPGSFMADTTLFKIFPAGGGEPIAVEGNIFADFAEENGRMDYLGNAEGNLMEEGAIYLVTANSTGVLRVPFVEGEIDADHISLISVEGATNFANTGAVVDVWQAADGTNHYMMYWRGNTHYDMTLNEDMDEFTATAITFPEAAPRANLTGARCFARDGKNYIAYSVKPEDRNYGDGFAIAELGADAVAFQVADTGKDLNNGGICVQWFDVDGDTFFQYAGANYIACYEFATEAADTYAVAGAPAALFGMENDWDPVAAPEMTLNEETGLYEWTSAETELEAGNIEFKVVKNHAWDECYPENNYVVAVENAGAYTLNVTYNPENNEVNATLSAVEGEVTYAVAGAPAALFGMENDWDPVAAPEMTLNEETGLYEWTSAETELEAGNIEFKVVKNHAWDECYPENNYVVAVENAGAYTLNVTYNPENNEVNATLNGAPEVETTYAVAGTPAYLFGMENDWDPIAAPEMTLNEETGIYEWTSAETELTAGTRIEFKVVKNHAWDECYPENNYLIDVTEEGVYTLTVTFEPENNNTVSVALTTIPVEPKVYIIGEVDNNIWATNVGVEMETEDGVIFTKDVILQRPADGIAPKVDEVEGNKYCYFSFATKLMADADNWEGLAPYRFGAVSEATEDNPNGDFRFYKNMMGLPLALTFEDGKAFQVEEGTYTFTVNMEDMTLTIVGESFTGIENLNMSNVKGVRYFNLQGVESTTPFQGVNIVVKEMNDGSKITSKIVK